MLWKTFVPSFSGKLGISGMWLSLNCVPGHKILEGLGNGGCLLMCFYRWLMFEKTGVKKTFHLLENEGAKVPRLKCIQYDWDIISLMVKTVNDKLLRSQACVWSMELGARIQRLETRRTIKILLKWFSENGKRKSNYHPSEAQGVTAQRPSGVLYINCISHELIYIPELIMPPKWLEYEAKMNQGPILYWCHLKMFFLRNRDGSGCMKYSQANI